MAEGLALIIEDSQTQAQIIGRMLEDEDWSYVIAKSMAHAREIILNDHPRLLFVDVFLGEENTLPSLSGLRDMALESTICVMTAGSRDEAIDQTLSAARQASVDYILRKPFNRNQVRDIAQSALVDQAEGRHRKHALVIDDSLVVGTLTAQILSDSGYRVSVAKSMEEALSNVDIAHVDLVVSDIFMPGMGGVAGIKIIKSAWPKVKVLAMSAGLETRIQSERATYAAVMAGADAEISKPFTPAQLIDITLKMMNLAA
jgi:DNA-binding NtrC family response regulator